MSKNQAEQLKPYRFKPKWHAGKTELVRIPSAIKDRVLEYAAKVDREYKTDND